MRLTAFTDYSIRTLLFLALRPRKFVPVAEIATAYGISLNHLIKVVGELRDARDIETLRGPHGGVRLARVPEAINLGTVVRRTEPDMQIASCFASDGECRIQIACEVSRVLAEATQAFLGVLDRYTLADLLAHKRHALGQLLGVAASSYPAAVAFPSPIEIASDRIGPSGSSLAP